jgi:hypothetical protein
MDVCCFCSFRDARVCMYGLYVHRFDTRDMLCRRQHPTLKPDCTLPGLGWTGYLTSLISTQAQTLCDTETPALLPESVALFCGGLFLRFGSLDLETGSTYTDAWIADSFHISLLLEQ